MKLLRGRNRPGIAGVVLFLAAMAEAVTALAVVPRPPVESRFAHPRVGPPVQTMSPLPESAVETRAGTIADVPAPPVVAAPVPEHRGCESYEEAMSFADTRCPPREKPAYTEPGANK